MALKTYDPAMVSISMGGVPISGYAEDSFISVERDEDAFELSVGANGEGTRSKSNNKSGTITMTLAQSSDSNVILSGFAQADELANSGVFPVLIKDNSGKSLHFAATAWIQKIAPAEYAAASGEREWVIRTDDLQSFIGGN